MGYQAQGSGLWLTFGLLSVLGAAGAVQGRSGSRDMPASQARLWSDLDAITARIALAVREGDLDELAGLEPDLDELLARARSMGVRRRALERIEGLVI